MSFMIRHHLLHAQDTLIKVLSSYKCKMYKIKIVSRPTLKRMPALVGRSQRLSKGPDMQVFTQIVEQRQEN